MRAITLWQPWASLIACGAKRYETRSWVTKYRGPIAIHAATKDPKAIFKTLPLNVKVAMSPYLIEHYLFWDDIPRGAIVATAELVECWKITDNGHTNGSDRAASIEGGVFEGKTNIVEGDEILFGDWTPGRYAWEIANVKILPEPIPQKGQQGLWRWDE